MARTPDRHPAVRSADQPIDGAEPAVARRGSACWPRHFVLLLTFGSVVATCPSSRSPGWGATRLTRLGAPLDAVDVDLFAGSIGLGVGIDYTLLIGRRFHESQPLGLDPEHATMATLDAAGATVLLSSSTIIMSMLRLLAIRLSFMRGAAVVTMRAGPGVPSRRSPSSRRARWALGKRIDRWGLPLPRRTTSCGSAS